MYVRVCVGVLLPIYIYVCVCAFWRPVHAQIVDVGRGLAVGLVEPELGSQQFQLAPHVSVAIDVDTFREFVLQHRLDQEPATTIPA